MRRRVTAAGGALALLVAAPAAGFAESHAPDPVSPPAGPTVVASDLNNPRQLTWTPDHDALVVAEAGRGAPAGETSDCSGEPGSEQCVGSTGSVSVISSPESSAASSSRVIEGLPSAASPNGSFAVGTNGAFSLEVIDEPDAYAVAQFPGLDLPEELPDLHEAPPTAQGLYAAVDAQSATPGGEPPPEFTELPGGDLVFLVADLHEAEAEQNPGGGAIESNPYAVVVLGGDPANPDDGYALVADAGANVVWRVAPSESTPSADHASPPEFEVSVFASFPDRPVGSEEGTEFVPTALALHEDHVYVGGLGSGEPGVAEVVQYTLEGVELQRWSGFTGITGLAVTDDHLYVSQIFGDEHPAPGHDALEGAEPPTGPTVPGNIVRVNVSGAGERQAVDAPFPAGLAVHDPGGGDEEVLYAAVNSVAPAEGVTELMGPGSSTIEGGQVWRVESALFGEHGPGEPPSPNLDAIRAATSKYSAPEAAVEAGYIPDPHCVVSPAGVMGHHYLNPWLVDSTVDPLRPEVLLYQPVGPEGALQLVAVEWIVLESESGMMRPHLGTEPFKGPMPGHTPGMPTHYDLHAWIFQENPNGVFADWNPAGTCGEVPTSPGEVPASPGEEPASAGEEPASPGEEPVTPSEHDASV